METIFALSSAHGKAGVAIIRVSGPDAFAVCRGLCGRVPALRQAWLSALSHKDVHLDQALVLAFAAGHSFTGEDVVEFQTHGGIAVVTAVCEAIGTYPNVRPAEPGEFTRRALENECLDIAQIEGLADLLDAETEAQRRQALRVLSGELGDRAAEWRTKLVRALALTEVTIDFSDEEIPDNLFPEVGGLIEDVNADLTREIDGSICAERIRAGFEVAIIGAPNVGKSTLLNALAGRQAAITSEIAGTTRDVIEVRMDLSGLPVTVMDTAGVRETSDPVEKMGVDLALSRAEQADIRVFLVNAGDDFQDQTKPGDIVLRAKSDLSGRDDGVSGLTGQGVPELLARLTAELKQRSAGVGLATRLRHMQAMQAGQNALVEALLAINAEYDCSEIIAENLRSAVHMLDSLVGKVDVEHVLDEIFSSFCLGK